MKNKEEVMATIGGLHSLLERLNSLSSMMWGLSSYCSEVPLMKQLKVDEELDKTKEDIFIIYRRLRSFMKDKLPDHSEIGCNCNE